MLKGAAWTWALRFVVQRPATQTMKTPTIIPVRFFALLVVTLMQLFDVRAQKAEPRWVSHHRAEMKYRAMALLDENGQIAPDGLLKAVQQKQQMKFDPAAWPGVAQLDSPDGKLNAGIGP